MSGLNLLVLSDPTASYLKPLEGLPPETHIVVGKDVELFRQAVQTADVLVNANQPRALFREVFLMCPRLRWVHFLSAGIENHLFQELVQSPIPVTNAAGVFARSLSEFVVAGMLFFSKDIGRLVRQRQEGRWEQFDSEELFGKTMGIVGYGGLGKGCARLAKAFGMRVIAVRRRPELSEGDPLLDRTLPTSSLLELMAESDYVVASSPNTPETRGLIGEAAFAAMKPTGVILNIGRGPVISEDALVAALREKRIRGAALDVFDKEPLPAGHPFYSFDNVLLSPHAADHVPGWMDGAVHFFVKNFHRFVDGQPLENLVDKNAGY